VNPNNRLQPPYQYDASGNMTADATHTYFYDAESRLIQVGGTLGNCSTATACYVYDAEGQRLEKLTGGTTTVYLRNSKGEVVAETDGGNTLLRAGYVYAGGSLLAEYENSTTNFVLKDHLGDTRVMTTYSTTAAQDAQVYDSMDYLPYGEQIAGGTGTTHKFTGKERDAESGLDDFDARYYSSNLGRFVSADWSATPVPVPYADFNDPQSLNLYTYVRNVPTVNVDADGHDLKVAPELQAAVATLRQESPSFDAELAAHEGKDRPNLDITSGPTPNDPNGQPSTGNTSASLDWYMVVISSNNEDPIHYSRYTGATVTINTSILGDENQVEDVMSHEVGHVNHARTKPDENGRESAHTHFTHGAQDHDQRPEEKKANEFKEKVKADRKRYKEAQARAKKAEKHKKKDATAP
jgi:RHS repeat-associated protein